MSAEHVKPTIKNLCALVKRYSAAAVFAVVTLAAMPAQAQFIPCLPVGQPLLKIPEFVSSGGVLRATVLLSDEQERITFRQPPGSKPGSPGTSTVCAPQYVRTFRGIGAQPALPPTPAGQYADPVPGPTLRARVGDVVNLTFLNQINANDFGDSIDRAENGLGNGCDESSSGYPNSTKGGDTFPDCFHGSSTGNIHFHGTHTNPNTTGDNVFIEVRPSPRNNNQPTITEATFKQQFDRFYAECTKRLQADVLLEWPTSWNDPPLGPPSDPKSWTAAQKQLLLAYDKGRPKPQQLWPVDEQQLHEGAWPQYYIGAYPYCFHLPDYGQKPWPPTAASAHAGMQMGSMGMSAPLQMGQSPGTHWYHAHKHGSTAINVSNGMTGVFIIEGKYDDDLNAFYGSGWTRTQPVMVINQLGVTPNLERRGPGQTDKGADFSVNGRQQPVVTMQPGEVQMWRIANTSSRAGAFFAAPPSGFEWKQLAQDGVQLADANYQGSHNGSFMMAAGNRIDILIKAPTTPGTYAVQVQNAVDPSDLASAAMVTLVSVNVAGTPATGARSQFIPQAPSLPPFLADIAPADVKGTKTITFASSKPPYAQHTIDGQKFSGNIGAAVLLNNVEEWKIVNETYGPLISHPFHIHINPFQVVEVFAPNATIPQASGPPIPKYVFDGSPLQPGQCAVSPADQSTWKPCGPPATGPFIWWDVFPIPSGKAVKIGTTTTNIPGYFKMRSRFVDFPGLFVIHCHILAHEDRGMMTIVDVVPYKTALSHQ